MARKRQAIVDLEKELDTTAAQLASLRSRIANVTKVLKGESEGNGESYGEGK